jgi:hypothetical protein
MRPRRKWKTKPATPMAGETSDSDDVPDTDEPASELEPSDEPASPSYTLSVASPRTRLVGTDRAAAAAAFRAGMPRL